MEKEIIITPETIGDSKGPIISINKDEVFFNGDAVKLLALQEGDSFSFVFKNNKLYYKQEVNKGFKLKKRIKTANYESLGYYSVKIYRFFKENNIPTGKYSVGIMKDGLRELIHIDKNKSK